MNWKFSQVENPLFCEFILLPEMERIEESKIVRNEFDFLVRAKKNAKEQDRTFFEGEQDREFDILLKEINFYREFLKLSGGARVFSVTKRNPSIEIEESVEIIDHNDFLGHSLLKEMLFSSNNQLREISGFQYCSSLCRIEIPPSIEVIGMYVFRL
jgi:hypothetical protein